MKKMFQKFEKNKNEIEILLEKFIQQYLYIYRVDDTHN